MNEPRNGEQQINDLDKRLTITESNVAQLTEDVRSLTSAVRDGFSGLDDKLNDANTHINRTPFKDYIYCIVGTVAITSAVLGGFNWWLANDRKPLEQKISALQNSFKSEQKKDTKINEEFIAMRSEVRENVEFRKKWYEKYQILPVIQSLKDDADYIKQRVEALEDN